MFVLIPGIISHVFFISGDAAHTCHFTERTHSLYSQSLVIMYVNRQDSQNRPEQQQQKKSGLKTTRSVYLKMFLVV